MTKNISIKMIADSALIAAQCELYHDKEISLLLYDRSHLQCAEIKFICLENDVESLCMGYLEGLGICRIASQESNNNVISIHLDMPRDSIQQALAQKDIIQTCESIITNDIKNTSNALVVPFNGSKHTLNVHAIMAHLDFYTKIESKIESALHHCRLAHSTRIFESYDTNAKNALYKVIGKAACENLLDSVLLLDLRLDMELLKKILCYKITFVISNGNPSFCVVKYAQKFGITLMAYHNPTTLQILTHQVRIKQD